MLVKPHRTARNGLELIYYRGKESGFSLSGSLSGSCPAAPVFLYRSHNGIKKDP